MRSLIKKRYLSDTMRFTLPVILENVFTTGIGLVFSSILGGISASSLAAAGTGNQILTFVTALFQMVITGASILVALNAGGNHVRKTSEIVEQAAFLVPIMSVTASVLLLIVSSPMIRLLMPGAGDAFFREGRDYYRILLISLPALILTNTFSGILRAAGESQTALFCTILTNIVQIASAFLFVSVCKLGIVGAGLSYVVCRYVSAGALFYAVLRHHRRFLVRFHNMLRPNPPVIREIMRVGLPCVMDSAAVQGGYMLINSLLIGLGEEISSVYNVIFTLITFSAIAQAIVNISATTIVGQKVGGGRLSEARKSYIAISAVGILSSVVLALFLMSAPEFFVGLFTKNDVILEKAADLIWLTVLFGIPAVAVNAAEPAARVGGMGKGVMISCIACVWLLRVPLTWFFCYRLDMGVTGVYLANTVACYARTAVAIFLIYRKSWGTKTV